MVEQRRRILLTGGAGLLGRALLASRPHDDITVFRHRSPVGIPGLAEVCGDIRGTNLGIADAEYQKLATETDLVIHCAAMTRFGASQRRIETTNTEGTINIVKFAETAKAKLIYLSTAFVEEDPFDLAPESAYEDSKRVAERHVAEFSGDALVVRPSIVVGDSHSGEVSTYQGFHQVVGGLVAREIPVLPAEPGMLCDFVAQDWVADAIWAVARHPDPRREIWVTAGEQALTVEEILQVAIGIGNEFGFEGDEPRTIPYSTLERLFLPAFLPSLPKDHRRRFKANLKLARYMNQKRPLPSSEQYLREELGVPER